MRYEVRVLERAVKALEHLQPRDKTRLLETIAALAENPRPSGVKKLAGHEPLYRVRVGDFRVIYAIRDNRLMVIVVLVGHRREVYAALSRIATRQRTDAEE